MDDAIEKHKAYIAHFRKICNIEKITCANLDKLLEFIWLFKIELKINALILICIFSWS